MTTEENKTQGTSGGGGEEDKKAASAAAETKAEKETKPAADEDKKAAGAELTPEQKRLKKIEAELSKYKEKEKAEEDAKKTAEQRLAELNAELAKTKRDNLVAKVALKKGLDADLVDRVRGENEEDIEADIDLLLSKFKPAANGEAVKKIEVKSTSTTSKTDAEKDDAPLGYMEARRKLMARREA